MFAILTLLVWAPTAEATTSTTDLEYGLLAKINDARSDHGLRPLRPLSGDWSVAGTRAARMASTNVLSHSIAGSLSAQLRARDVPWYGYGEDIGYTRARRGTTAMNELFRLWQASPEHWKLMMSSSYNYIGVGLAYRSSNNKTFGSLVFTESRDLTDARAYMNGVSSSGSSATWSWWGTDPVLQTHTAGTPLVRRPGPGRRRQLPDGRDEHDRDRADLDRPRLGARVPDAGPGPRPGRQHRLLDGAGRGPDALT